MQDIEIEAKFLEIDAEKVKARLRELGAEDLGEDHIRERIFYDKAMTWPKQEKFARIRETARGIRLTYKHDTEATLTGTMELEFGISDADMAQKFLEAVGLVTFRVQEKRRHTLRLDGVTFDIDTWPKVPTYLEIEGPSEEKVESAAKALGLDWSTAVFGTAARVIEDVYKIPVKSFHIFTFDKME